MNRKVRRRYLVNGRYQLRQAAGIVLANILVVALTSFLLAWLYLVVWDTTLICNHNRQVPMMIALFSVAVLLATLFFSFRRSREVAGMMEKLVGILTRAAAGEIPEGEVTFRKTDSFLDLTAPLNACLDQLRLFQEKNGREGTEAAELERLARQIGMQQQGLAEIVLALESLAGERGAKE